MLIFNLAMGFLFGVATGSMCEWINHRFFAHTPRLIRSSRLYKCLPKWIHEVFVSHAVVHHGKTFCKNYFVQFSTKEDEEKVFEYLECLGVSVERNRIEQSKFGLTTSYLAFPSFVWLPFILLPCMYWLLGYAGSAGFAAGGSLPFIMSKFIHPLLHIPPSQFRESKSLLLRCLSRSFLWRRLVFHHWLHHKYPRVNLNLIPIIDFVLMTYRSGVKVDFGQFQNDIASASSMVDSDF